MSDLDKDVVVETGSEAGKADAPEVVRPRSAGTPWLLWLLVVMLCGALGAFYWQQTRFSLAQSASLQSVQQSHQQLSQQLSAAQAEMRGELDAQLGTLQQSADALEAALTRLQAAEQQSEQRLQGAEQRMERQLQDTRTLVSALQRQLAGLQQRDTRWLNAEAAHLMRLAEQKLVLEYDASTALQLLRMVDGLLRNQFDNLAQTSQQNLAQDIAAIEAAPAVDRLAMSARITELAARLDTISVSSGRQAAYRQALGDNREQMPVIAHSEGWMAAFINLLRSVFVWRDSEQNALEFLPPDQESLLRHQLLLQLEQARLALMQADQALFEHALQQLANGLQRYFVQGNEQAAALLADVQALGAERIQPALPDISGTRALVEQLAAGGGEISQ